MTIFVFEAMPTLQIVINIISNLLQIMYILGCKPMSSFTLNLIEVLNLYASFLLSVIFYIFLNESIDPVIKYNIGWVYICIFILTIVLNILIIICESLTYGKLIYKKIKNLFLRMLRNLRRGKNG